MALSITRRQAVLGLAAAGSGLAVAGGAGVAWITSVDDDQVLRAMLRRLVGPVPMAEEDFAAFRDDLRSEGRLDLLQSRARRALALARAANLPVAAPKDIEDSVTLLERQVLTAFIIRTNYHDRSEPSQEVAYLGTGP